MYQFPANIFLAMFVFMSIAAVAGMVSEYKKRKMELEPLRAAIERGQQLDPVIIERLMAREKQEEVKPVQLRIGGIISIASGVGLSLLAACLNAAAPRAVFTVFGIALLAVCVGIGLLISARVLARHQAGQVTGGDEPAFSELVVRRGWRGLPRFAAAALRAVARGFVAGMSAPFRLRLGRAGFAAIVVGAILSVLSLLGT